MRQVAVIDYGMGNLHSIAKALQHVGEDVEVVVSAEPEVILAAERVVFPGVGAIADCMAALQRLGLDEVIRRVAADRPLLGICLGLQALLEESEEGGRVRCLGLLPGRVVRFSAGLRDEHGLPLKIPHMGWNQVWPTRSHPLWEGIDAGTRFYFVHSYYAKPARAEDVAAVCRYPDPFACALARDNLFAVQFHPEKSQWAGLRLLQNFLRWTP
ncbi:imidazole glycerol-phosphate synthase subunit HisH [Methylomarinovum caldicuralii]|uniref:Imidazole glycerol phosphate synthase subunit HisH n=1 Tax=Methylomarinovum caldicuralii TaxID=438856 RepID=A0AAU9CS61_9GAMM|nr:imidazole glycerol phosphate synthase subunit HisH [Methylomarinovum caldicuralii]BCX82362.1 imidazole glycerol-phosphate synthase subunit HisH [Methylomarinovum caldicuralii]